MIKVGLGAGRKINEICKSNELYRKRQSKNQQQAMEN
jgi:hypothetical protein